jgi:hypothetical protein
MGGYGIGDGATGIPDPRTLLRMGLDLSLSNTDGQYGTGMGLALSLTTQQGRYIIAGTSSGMGLVPSLSHTGRRYWTGMESRPTPNKVVGSGMPVAPSPTHTVPFLNPKRYFHVQQGDRLAPAYAYA